MRLFKLGKRMYQSSNCVHKVRRRISGAIKQVYKFVKQIYQELGERIDVKEITEEVKQYAQEISVDKIRF